MTSARSRNFESSDFAVMLEENIRKVRASLPSHVTLVAVSKTVEAARIEEAFRAGQKVFGENRVQELLEKKKVLKEAIEWHLIGSLQTNKVKQIVGEVALIHSLDRAELAQEIEKQAEKKNLTVDCLIQVKSTDEETKQGMEPEKVPAFLETLQKGRIRVRGFMTIGPLSGDKEKIRKSFSLVKMLQIDMKKRFPQMDLSVLSMGMSGDYETAIEQGSTMVRIGTAIFGARK